MEVTFADDDLERIAIDPDFRSRLPDAVVTAYQKCLFIITNARDERDLYSGYRSLHFEKLKGKRQHQHSMRLNKQFRLIVELLGDGAEKTIHVVEIVDYH